MKQTKEIRSVEKNADENQKKKYLKISGRVRSVRWMLVFYDVMIYIAVAILLLVLYEGIDPLSTTGIFQQIVLSMCCIFSARFWGNVYGQVWRYGGIQCYIRLLFADAVAFVCYLCLEMTLPIPKITFARMLSLSSVNTLGALAIRMLYRYAYKCGNQDTSFGKFLAKLLKIVAGIETIETGQGDIIGTIKNNLCLSMV